MWPSPSEDEVGTPIKVISEFNGWPACAPVNASPAMLPPPAHDSGSGWIANPFLYGSFIRYPLPVFIFEQLAKVYAEYAGNVKSLNSAEIDPDVILLSVAEGDTAQRLADAYQELSTITTTQGNDFFAEISLGRLKSTASNLRTARDLLRVELSNRHDKQFPSLEETAKDPDAALADTTSQEDATESDSTPAEADSDSGDTDKLAVLRAWSDVSGRHQIQAKYRGLEAGKVKLEKADGTVVRGPISTLSEPDQRFIGVIQ